MNPLDISKIEREIKIHGVPVEYQRSVLCQCQSKNFGEARVDCPICSGLSWRWITPSVVTIGDALFSGVATDATSNTIQFAVGFSQKNDIMQGRTVVIVSGTGAGQKMRIQSYDTTTRRATIVKAWTTIPAGATYAIYETLKAVITSRDSTKDRKEAGQWETGQANCTLPGGIIPADMDKIIVLQDRIAVNNEMFEKGAKYPDNTSRERLRFRRIISVDDVRTLDDTFEVGTDVNVDLDTGKITWSGAHIPVIGEQYTVRYTAIPEYLVMKNAPRFRQDGLNNPAPHLTRILRLDRYTPSNETGSP